MHTCSKCLVCLVCEMLILVGVVVLTRFEIYFPCFCFAVRRRMSWKECFVFWDGYLVYAGFM